jgi:hypothetical protein
VRADGLRDVAEPGVHVSVSVNTFCLKVGEILCEVIACRNTPKEHTKRNKYQNPSKFLKV